MVTKDSSEKTGELRIEQEKREFLVKLYPTLKADSVTLKKAIENHTVQLFDVPGRNLYIISFDGINVDCLYEKSGKRYYNFSWSRENHVRYSALRGFSEPEFTETFN